jgi:phage host-nuclease inhibitor protein Gam
MAELQNQLRLDKQRAQNDHGKLAREMEGLRDGIRQTEEKYSAELIRLQQENEQLKKDIQQLKNLEIQLEKREKMLR